MALKLRNPGNRLATIGVSVACAALMTSCGDDGWTVSPDFDGKNARLEISGAACLDGRCIAVNDETRRAQVFAIEGRRIVPGGRIALLPKGSGEIDAEAAASDGAFFYVAGSHGLSRNKAELRPSQFLVFRWQSGTQDIERSDRLRAIIRETPGIGTFAERPLGENGANIEGMAVTGERLFFGFRGPSVGGEAFVLETGTEALFGDAEPSPTVHRIALGPQIGIRDMARVAGGFLLLTGPVNDDPKVQSIAFWSPGTPAETLAILKPAGDGKAETLLILEETGGTIRLLVFYDSLPNGAPREVEVTRPK